MSVFLITGCSSGFGFHTALEAGRRGHVVYAGVRAPDGPGAAALAEAARGLRVRLVKLDVTVATERDAAVERVLREEQRLDGLVNNAGQTLGGFLEVVDEGELRALFEVNVFGAWALTQRCLPQLRAQQSGTIVMMSSTSGRMALPGLGAYASTKYALEGMSEAWRHELAPFGVRVVLVEPALHRTAIVGRNRHVARRTGADDDPYAAWSRRLDARARSFEAAAGDPETVARRVCDLLVQRRPRLRYPLGPGARLRDALARIAPFWLVEQIVRRAAAGPETDR